MTTEASAGEIARPDLSSIAAEIRKAAEAATPGPWHVAKFHDEDDLDVWSVSNGKRDRLHHRDNFLTQDAEYIALANPANILPILDALAAAEARIAELEAGGWQSMETAPKDGRIIWAYLFHSGIRAVRWETDAGYAADHGGEPSDYVDGWFEVYNPDEEWSPKFWLPYDAIPALPEAPNTNPPKGNEG